MMGDNNKRQFLVVKFDGILVPIYIKINQTHIGQVNRIIANEEQRRYEITLTTGYFDYKKNDIFKANVRRDERFGDDIVEIALPFDATEWFRYEYIDQDCNEVKWSRKYLSEVYGVRYERPTEDEDESDY